MYQFISPVILLFLSLASFQCSCAATAVRMDRGFHQSPDEGEVVLSSQDGTFTCGFNKVGTNAYSFSIWYSNTANRTVVWTANRDSPVNGRGSRITLQRDGNLVLTAVDGSPVWDTKTNFLGVSAAELLNTGNLVLRNVTGSVVWQSFDFPTDTLLPYQALTKGKRLVSPMSRGALNTGFFVLYFDIDNLLRLMYDGTEITTIYWPTPGYGVFKNGMTLFKYNSTCNAVLDAGGRFLSSDGLDVQTDDFGARGVLRRLSMDYDGRLRIYSLNASTGGWIVSWEAVPQLCNVHGLCGKNGICEQSFGLAKCSCPPGYEMTDPGDWNKGCKLKFNQQACGEQMGTGDVDFVEIPHTDFYGFDMIMYNTKISFEFCRNVCALNCSCLGFGYRITGDGFCFPKSILFNGFTSINFPSSFYIKLPKNMTTSSAMNSSSAKTTCSTNNSDSVVLMGSSNMYHNSRDAKWTYLFAFASSLGGLELLFILTGWWFIFARQDTPKSLEEGYRMISSQFRKFTYGELKEATRKFKEELGRGGSGVVYRGVLDDKRVVAVKKLTNATRGEEEFWAEVSVIGRINHMNLVRMWGFCSEGQHRLLVYEYVENHSLDKYLFDRDDRGSALGWSQRFKIALGTARGLAYLHHECLEWIIHCDVKPENILLDHEFEAKIADFGLAKLWKRDDAGFEFSRMRGTSGYIAPEWLLNLPITAKVDVYSYGVVLLEILRGSRVSSWAADDDDGKHSGVRQLAAELKDLVQGQDASGIEDFIDHKLNGQYDQKQAMSMVQTAASCLEEDPRRRPTMNDVVKMLMSTEESATYPAFSR